MASVQCYSFAIDKFGATLVTYEALQSPCGPVNDTNKVVPCCGNGDTCLSNNICHKINNPNGTTGYYRPGCTDPSFPEPACRTQCSE